MNKILFAVVFFLGCNMFSQEIKYAPKDMDSLASYLKKINENQIDFINNQFQSKVKRDIRDVFTGRDERVITSIEDSVYVFDDKIAKNLKVILDEIYASNPDLNRENDYYFIKNSMIANAACYGDGMYEVNLGLFTTMNSDDELAFVVCHEIAHKMLSHSIKRMDSIYSKLNSDEYKAKVKEIKKMEYGAGKASRTLMDEFSINILNHSKTAESQADSLGFVLFSNTKYKKENALASLHRLEDADGMVLSYKVKLDSIFNFKEYPFKKYWIKKPTSIFDLDTKDDDFAMASDSIQTHPEIPYRIKKIETEFNITFDSLHISGENKAIVPLKKAANLLTIQCSIEKKSLDLALYQLNFLYDNSKVDKEFYLQSMSVILGQLYSLRKKHELGKYVPVYQKYSAEKNINQIRLFIHNLELGEMKKMATAFINENNNEASAATLESFNHLKSILK